MLLFAYNGTLIEMSESIDLPPEIEQVADLLGKQCPEVRDLFRFALVMAMIDDEKAWLTGRRIEGEREYLTVRTIAGDVFEIMRPPISEKVDAELMRDLWGSRGEARVLLGDGLVRSQDTGADGGPDQRIEKKELPLRRFRTMLHLAWRSTQWPHSVHLRPIVVSFALTILVLITRCGTAPAAVPATVPTAVPTQSPTSAIVTTIIAPAAPLATLSLRIPTPQLIAPTPTMEAPPAVGWKNLTIADFSAFHSPVNGDSNEHLIFGGIPIDKPACDLSPDLVPFLGRWEGYDYGPPVKKNNKIGTGRPIDFEHGRQGLSLGG